VLSLIVFVLIFTGSQAWATKPTNADCLACHGDSSLSKEVNGKQASLYVNEATFKNSIHGSMFSCTDCHKDITSAVHERQPEKPTCASCHADQQAAYDKGAHAKALQKGDNKAARCTDCHGGPHEILPASDPKSKVNHANIPKTCGACHGQKFVMESSGLSTETFTSYQESVHGKAIAKDGESKAAVCTDCHGDHDIRSAADAKSPIFKFSVPQTCAKCHAKETADYMVSIHGQGISRGNWLSPVCTDCHGIHSIKAPSDPSSSVATLALARSTCVRCHESMRLTQEFGISGRRETTYNASYHGLASQRGSTVVANCASCHGVHNILPSSDPRSTINPANLAKTCGQCHPGAGQNFTKGKIHIDVPLSADIGSTAVRWIRRFYLSMIIGVIGGMLLHNLIIWRRKAVERRKKERRIVPRMTYAQRIQHLLLLSSFIVLVITGFALKYPDSWFASLLVMSENVRSIIHRVAGTVLIGVGIFHVFYLMAKREGRRLMWDMLPELKDATDVVDNMGHYLGFKAEKPAFKRFSYGEKAEYWALVWGTIVMAATGLALWFRVPVGNRLPRWWLDIATAIHFYEAILATLAIVAWHFYAVIFDPDVYPMNWAWFDGRMSVEHYEDEHALDGETILKAIEAERAAVLLDGKEVSTHRD
jgi:cytochrome b subunit of formate dehydrogenase